MSALHRCRCLLRALSLCTSLLLIAFLLAGCGGGASEAAAARASTSTTTTTATTTTATTSTATTTTTTVSTTTTTTGVVLKVLSYNLYWWNAFEAHPYKGKEVVKNIKNNLLPDIMGVQECDNAEYIEEQTGYLKASDFVGAQGTFIKNDAPISVLEKGLADIRAQGRWGPRYVTWAKLHHRIADVTFWHFNTHWCVLPYCNSIKRWEGAKNMHEIMIEKAGDMPAIITGDFNGDIGEPGMQHFLTHGYKVGIFKIPDIIYYSEAHFELINSDYGERKGSDHNPIWVELEFKKFGGASQTSVAV